MGSGRVPGPVGRKGGAKEQGDPRPVGAGASGSDPRPIGTGGDAQGADAPPERLPYVPFRRVMRDSVSDPGFPSVVSEPGGHPTENWQTFDWMSDFQIGGQACFHPRTIQPQEQTLRQRMVRELQDTDLARALNEGIVAAALGSGSEHAAYLHEGGRVERPFTSGQSHGVDAHEPESRDRLTGYVHTHPSSTAIRPPTFGRDFLDSQEVPVASPIQLMIELRPRRVWALISPNLTCVIGLLGSRGFYELDPTEPQAGQIWEMFATPAALRARRAQSASPGGPASSPTSPGGGTSGSHP